MRNNLKVIGLLCLSVFVLISCSSDEQTAKIQKKIYSKESIGQKIKNLESLNSKRESQAKELAALYNSVALESTDIEITEYVVEKTEELQSSFSDNVEICAYLGSMMTLIGRDSTNPIKQIYYTKEGVSVLDEAVKKDTKNPETRITRGYVAINLPSFFEKLNIAISDFEYVVNLYESNNLKLDKNTIVDIYLNLAAGYKRAGKTGKAVSTWEKCYNMMPDSEQGKKSKEMLAIYKD